MVLTLTQKKLAAVGVAALLLYLLRRRDTCPPGPRPGFHGEVIISRLTGKNIATLIPPCDHIEQPYQSTDARTPKGERCWYEGPGGAKQYVRCQDSGASDELPDDEGGLASMKSIVGRFFGA